MPPAKNHDKKLQLETIALMKRALDNSCGCISCDLNRPIFLYDNQEIHVMRSLENGEKYYVFCSRNK